MTYKASKVGIFFVCLIFGTSQIGHTVLNKKMMQEHHEVSPLVLLSAQCLANMLVSLTLMLIKEIKPKCFSSLRSRYGIIIPDLAKIVEKFEIGSSIGLAYSLTAICGMFALKYSSLAV